MRQLMRAVPIALALAVLGAAPATAHTAFESSNPSDGETLSVPVHRIVLVFSGEAEPAGDGFVLLDPSGTTRQPSTATSTDGLTWVLEFEPAIAGGVAGLRWSVAAPDAHPIQGSLSFEVATSLAPGVPLARPAARPGADAADVSAFLDTGSSKAPLVGGFGLVARMLSLLGALVAIGGIVFAAVVMRGSERDIRSVLFWVRRMAVILGFAAILELMHQIAIVNGNWLTVWPPATIADVLWSPLGLAISLRLVGAALMLRAHLDVVPAAVKTDPVVIMHSAVSIGAGPGIGVAPRGSGEPYLRSTDKAWRVDGEHTLILVGAVAALVSFTFDGHTVTEGLRPCTALVDIAHVAAGAVWAGGLVMLAHVIWLRHRRGADSRALQLAVRFSVVAASALVVAGVAGSILTLIILDSVSELWATSWGRVLLGKVALVAAAAGAGAYNHKVLIPRMMRLSPNDPAADAEFRRTVTLEGGAMGLVILLTAVLLASAS
jgi:copper transport protein